VNQPICKPVTDYLDFTGTTQAIASVDIRARVKGFLQSVHFKDGAMVKQGDLLYVALAVLLVYLVLCAQYESWTSPAGVILVVPLALLGTAAALVLTGLDNNVYTQIGIVLLIALASKNAILIVEFARELRAQRQPLLEAAVQAARMRFRPILMTSFAFILGVYPLVGADGAGAESRRALGTAVFGGMIASTFLAVLFVPVFYVTLQRLSEWAGRKK
jgi:HAE1 family hydrophobic/amphiphilic exporter-1